MVGSDEDVMDPRRNEAAEDVERSFASRRLQFDRRLAAMEDVLETISAARAVATSATRSAFGSSSPISCARSSMCAVTTPPTAPRSIRTSMKLYGWSCAAERPGATSARIAASAATEVRTGAAINRGVRPSPRRVR